MHYIKQLAEWRRKGNCEGIKKKKFAYRSQARQHEPRKKIPGVCNMFFWIQTSVWIFSPPEHKVIC